MSLIEWTDKLSVGVEAIDADHRKLVTLLNRLHRMAREEADTGLMAEVLDELIRYTQYHFQAEEQLMRLARYPDYEAHKARHEELKEEVTRLRADFERKPEIVHGHRMFTFLSDWLMRHILREDMQYAPYLQERLNRKEKAGGTE